MLDLRNLYLSDFMPRTMAATLSAARPMREFASPMSARRKQPIKQLQM